MKNQIGDSQLTIECLQCYKPREIERHHFARYPLHSRIGVGALQVQGETTRDRSQQRLTHRRIRHPLQITVRLPHQGERRQTAALRGVSHYAGNAGRVFVARATGHPPGLELRVPVGVGAAARDARRRGMGQARSQSQGFRVLQWRWTIERSHLYTPTQTTVPSPIIQ